MTWQTRRDLDDPMLILMRKQERARKRNPFKDMPLTEDQHEQIEYLLAIWYRHEAGYRPALGAPRVSCYSKQHRSSEQHDDGDDRDAILDRIKAEAVGACVEDLHYLQRAAVGVHMRNKVAGVSVHRSARLGTIEEQRAVYLAAKVALWPMLRRKELVR